jgi:hypothetical protein
LAVAAGIGQGGLGDEDLERLHGAGREARIGRDLQGGLGGGLGEVTDRQGLVVDPEDRRLGLEQAEIAGRPFPARREQSGRSVEQVGRGIGPGAGQGDRLDRGLSGAPGLKEDLVSASAIAAAASDSDRPSSQAPPIVAPAVAEKAVGRRNRARPVSNRVAPSLAPNS